MIKEMYKSVPGLSISNVELYMLDKMLIENGKRMDIESLHWIRL